MHIHIYPYTYIYIYICIHIIPRVEGEAAGQLLPEREHLRGRVAGAAELVLGDRGLILYYVSYHIRL